MFGGALQPLHLVLILALALIIFGPGKLGNLGGSVGKTIHDFREAMKDDSQTTTEGQKEGSSEEKPKS